MPSTRIVLPKSINRDSDLHAFLRQLGLSWTFTSVYLYHLSGRGIAIIDTQKVNQGQYGYAYVAVSSKTNKFNFDRVKYLIENSERTLQIKSDMTSKLSVRGAYVSAETQPETWALTFRNLSTNQVTALAEFSNLLLSELCNPQ